MSARESRSLMDASRRLETAAVRLREAAQLAANGADFALHRQDALTAMLKVVEMILPKPALYGRAGDECECECEDDGCACKRRSVAP